MISEEMNSYLSNIEEYIFDENKIVTYSWLSKSFGIHVNISKQLLYSFYENSPKKEELSVTYLLIGVPKNGQTCQVSIVKDRDLQESEDALSITSKHIYSIQKCKDLVDINVLYSAQKETPDEAVSKGISSIDFNCNERDHALIQKLRSKALPVTTNQQPVPTKKVNAESSSKNKSPIQIGKTNETNIIGNDKETVKSEVKKAVIPSMFNNAGTKKKPVEKAAVKNKKSQNIGAFFTKTVAKPNDEPRKIINSDKTKEEQSSNAKPLERLSPLKENKATLNICNENKTVETPREASPIKSKTVTKSKTSKKVEAKKRKKGPAKKIENEQKKRKRLVVLSDSESDNSSEDEKEPTRDPTPEPQPTVIPVDDVDDIISGTPEPSKKRKKKLVSKTFTSSDGYMVTEKEFVDASLSEDEDDMPEKKFKESPSKKNNSSEHSTIIDPKPVAPSTGKKDTSPKTKNPSPQKTKQASLTSFFKKK